MANKNFVVKNGLTVGNLAIDADSGNLISSGSATVASIRTNNYFYANGAAFVGGGSGSVGYTGSQGNTGLGFRIAKSYATLTALTADTAPSGIAAGEFAIIETGNVEDADNSKLYLWSGTAYSYVTDLSGAAGITGPQGSAGYTGSASTVAGFTGSAGADGIIGVDGYTGSAGFTGSAGADGIIGVDGYTGSAGFTGSAGTAGAAGFTGSAGVAGADGASGAAGFTGSTGSAGFTGSAGPTGYAGSIGLLDWAPVTGNYTATNRERLLLNSSAGAFTLTLPATPATGTYIQMTDGANLATNTVTVDRNGSTIESSPNNLILDVPNATFEFIYDGTTWQFTSTAGPRGAAGDTGFTGSAGAGFTGSAGTIGFTGSAGAGGADGGAGFTGSAGAGYTGSIGGTGFTGSAGDTGSAGFTGSTGFTGSIGNTGFTGSRGDTGLGFKIAKSYLTLAALQADTAPSDILAGEFALIETGNVEDADNSQLYRWTGSAYAYVNDLSGAAGITGPAGSAGYTGSSGTGYVGSAGSVGYTGSIGYTGSVGLLDWKPITSNHAADNRERIMLNSTAGSFNLTLPATPATGTYIQMTDGANLATYPVTVVRNGSTIENIAQDLLLDTPNATFEFIYDGATWQVTSTAGPRGMVGYTGSASTAPGYTGSQGPAGATGADGAGYTGSASTTPGYTGSLGYTGSVGETGPIGNTGYTGSAGIDGIDGANGGAGFTGSSGAGYTGSAGNTGFTGSNGVVGFTGSGGVGFTGSGGVGFTGSRGDAGFTGSIGVVGFTGSGGTGFTGSTGAGFTGSGGTGFTGSRGDTGIGFRIAKSYSSVFSLQADTSPTGITAGEFALVETGNVEDVDNSRLYRWTGSAYVYVNDLSGAAGLTGPAGAAGYTGSSGTQGSLGYTGSHGYTGSMALLDWTVITANYTATNRERLMLNSTAGEFMVTLPAAPTMGYYIQMTDGGNLLNNPVTIINNGATIENVAQNIVIDVPNATYEFIYDGATWQLTSTAGPRGAPGDLGYTGSIGAVGYTGSAGATGPQGPQGTSGAAAAVGYTGSAGRLELGATDGDLTVTGTLFVTGNIIPTSNNTVNIGSPTNRFGTLYVSANTIDIGGTTISTTPAGDLSFTTASGQFDITANSVNFLSNVASNNRFGRSPTYYSINMYQSGPLKLTTGTMRWYAPYDLTVIGIAPRVVSAANTAINLRIKKNGVLAVNMSIPANQYETAVYTSGLAMSQNDYLTVDVLQVGSAAMPGAELYIQFRYEIVL